MHQGDRRKILLKYPTRQRPAKFMENLDRYLTMASGLHDIHVVVSMDEADVSMNNPAVHRYLNRSRDGVKIAYHYGESAGKIHAINRDIPTEPWDIVIATADDMVPLDEGWDDVIVSDLCRLFPDTDGAINYNTDPRLDEKGFHTLVTLPVIGRRLYDRFGYIYHPDYRSEWCDNEQTEVFERLGKLQHIDHRPIKHMWSENLDSLMAKNMSEGIADKEIYLRRKALGFPRTTA
jgi:hypothetical protein